MGQNSGLLTIDDVLDTATELLGARFGGMPELYDPEDLGGMSSALVIRVRVAPNPFLQHRSIVVKQLPATGDAVQESAFLREIVAYQFATSLPEDIRPGPELLAHDVEHHILVLSDCGDAQTLADIMRSDNEDLTLRAFRSLGTALGRMHLGTSTREEGFNTLLKRMWSKHGISGEDSHLRDRGIVHAINFGLEVFEGSHIPVPQGVRSLAADAANRVEKGTHRAFTPFDLAPDNILMTTKVQFLDYEWAGFRDVLFDVASVVAGFPLHTSATRPSREAIEVFARAWREEVRGTWYRALDETRMNSLIAAALVGWLMISASVCFFGSAPAALAAGQEGMAAAQPEIRGTVKQLKDLANTASALVQFAELCDDNRAEAATQFATTAIAFVEQRIAAMEH